MGQGTETCTDRPAEVSVIRFVSRNRIEEIAPKKEIYMCKQRGCGKKFSSQDEYRTHETLEALKIRFICREPDCGEELSDPGSMWRHYQEWHNNETNVFICPYTSCNSVQKTSDNLEEHIEACHRQPPTLPTEPEVICFEGIARNEAEYFDADDKNHQIKEMFHFNEYKDEKSCSSFPKNEDLLITQENFLIKCDDNQPEGQMMFDEVHSKSDQKQKVEEQVDEGNNCSEDEEYTPKKQRMSRFKQEVYKCSVSGCGKTYKYISHYRHHQDSHKLTSVAGVKAHQKPKQRKASTVSFFLCKMPGCGAQVDDVTELWKHYQDNHANSKLPVDQGVKSNETFRCSAQDCGADFNTNFMLYKHFNEHHTKNFVSNSSSANTKTGNGSSILFVSQIFPDDAASQKMNFKTDFNAKSNDNENDYSESSSNDKSQLIKEESRD